MAGCSYGVPVIALPHPWDPPARPTLSSEAWHATSAGIAAIDQLLSSLEGLSDWRRDVDPGMSAVAKCLAALAARLATEAPPVPSDMVSDPTPIRSYFAIRSATMSAVQAATAEAAILARGAADLWAAPIDPNDIMAEMTAARSVLSDFIAHPNHLQPGPHTSLPVADYGSSGVGLERWIIGHQVYFVFNIRATATIHEALKALNQARDADATALLMAAARYVRGFTAAMAHAGAMPGVQYRDHVRPTMAPPDTTVPLTGRMHKEHRAFRAALDQLLGVVPESYSTLMARDEALAQARGALLEADLLDIERHTVIAAALVGDKRSLVQRRDYDNAVAMLRQMRTLRAARYHPLIRFGDRLAAEGIAQAQGRSSQVGGLADGQLNLDKRRLFS